MINNTNKFSTLDAQDETSKMAQIQIEEDQTEVIERAFLRELAIEQRAERAEYEQMVNKFQNEKFLDGRIDMTAWAKMASGFRF